MKKYSKFIAAAAGVAAVFGQVAADGSISLAEAGLLSTAIASAAAVFFVRNQPAS